MDFQNHPDGTYELQVGSVRAFEFTYTTLAYESVPLVISEVSMPFVPGDVDGDGEVTVADVILVLQNIAGLTSFNAQQLQAADVNLDGQINVGDAILMLRYIVGLIPSFP